MSDVQHISESLRAWIDTYIESKVSEVIDARMTQDRVMKLDDIADRYGVTRKTAENWKYSGQLPRRWPSGEVFLSDLEAMEADGVVPGKRGSKEWVKVWEYKPV